MGRFHRIRVVINITKPLKKCLFLEVEGGKDETVITILYERLPDFCFSCGILGHTFRDCDLVDLSGEGKDRNPICRIVASVARVKATRLSS